MYRRFYRGPFGYHRICDPFFGLMFLPIAGLFLIPIFLIIPGMLIGAMFRIGMALLPYIAMFFAIKGIANLVRNARERRYEEERYEDYLNRMDLHKFYENDAEELAKKYERRTR